MKRHIEFTVQDRFFAPVENALLSSDNTRVCTAISDLEHLYSGVGRAMANVASGRDWVQQADPVVGKPIKVSQFFDAVKSPRRLAFLKDVNADLVRQCADIGDDPFAEHAELENFEIFAGDGHYHNCSSHEEEIEGKRRAIGHFFFMNLRVQALLHLDIARPEIIKRKKKEHDITVLKRVSPEELRFGTPKGKQVLIVYDRAVVDFAQWFKWKRGKGIYIVTREKENMNLQVLGTPEVDRDDPRNKGVVADQLVGTSKNTMIRRVVYIEPVTGTEYVFLTNELNIPPGLVAYLYKRRWDIEKVFDETKNKLEEKKAWGKSDTAKCQQALFMCVAHNLILLFEHVLDKEEGIRDRIAEKRREKRNRQDAEVAAGEGRGMASMLKKVYKRVQRSLQFIRWLRMEFVRKASWREAIGRLRPVMAGYLL